MKLRVLQEDLANALNVASRFVSAKAQLPILSNVLLRSQKNRLVISATNLETSISLSIGSKMEKEGEITVPSKVIVGLISNLNRGQLSLVSEKERLKISSEGFKSSISGVNSSDFPKVPESMGKGGVGVSGERMTQSLSKVLFSASVDETRPVLTGVLLIVDKDSLSMVSTDGFRLSRKKVALEVDNTGFESKIVILPRSALSELLRVCGRGDVIFDYRENDRQVVFGVDSMVLSSRVIEGEFPDFERIIPKSSNIKVDVDKDDLLQSIKLASVFARDSANVVKLEVDEDGVNVLAESSQLGSQNRKVDAKVEGIVGDKDKFVIAFNYKFIEDFLGVVDGASVRIELSEPDSPGVFLDVADKNYLHIIMPVKI